MQRELTQEQIWDEALAHEGLLVRIVDRVFAKGVPATLSFDDLKQEGWIALHRAVTQFDPDRGYAFSTFAVPVIRNAVVTAVRRALAEQGANKGHAPLKYFARVESLDKIIDWIAESHQYGGKAGWAGEMEAKLSDESFEDDLVRRLDAEIWMDRLLSLEISERNLEMVLRRLQGEQYRDIAADYGVQTQRVEQIVRRTFDTLRAMDPERVAA